MSFIDRIFAGDEELGKKNDDHRPRNGFAPSSAWMPRQSMPPFRRRRVFAALIAFLLVYLFIRNLPTDLGPNSSRGDSRVTNRGIASGHKEAPIGPPPRPYKKSEAEEFYYEGSINFFKLSASLRAVIGQAGHFEANKNVLFAASSLKSASELLLLACEMARWKRNSVHFVLMGRDDLDVAVIKELNRINDEDCDIYWHDARPDYSRWSSEFRMEVSVAASLGHLLNYVRPQITITDHADREDRFFTKSVRSKAVQLGKSIIELPMDASENLMWLTRLDSGSLAAWHTTYVDIVIHAPPQSSGSLIRLMKSIEAADYFGLRRPHITIELPAEIDPPTLDFLENMVWPPIDQPGAPHASQVTLRHRLPRYGFTDAEASTHFIESFYPARPKNSHVLLLSPQIELSPVYFHYTMYNLLEYKNSNFGLRNQDSKNLMGISLELPSLYLNNSANLVPPITDPTTAETFSPKTEEPTPFLWQAPNSNAALYFGDKWIELHSFLSSRITGQDPDLAADLRPTVRQKVVSEYYPAWMEYVQELMRVREYSLLYPNFPESQDAIVTVHNELHQPPEEYRPSHPLSSSAPVPTLNPKNLFTIDPSAHLSSLPSAPESPLLTSSLMSLLPNSGDLPELRDLPLLSFEGNVLSGFLSESIAQTFANDFRREIGRCNANHKFDIEDMSANDLFCNFGSSEKSLDPETALEKESSQNDGHAKSHNQEDEHKSERKPQKSPKPPIETPEDESETKANRLSKDGDLEKMNDNPVGQVSPADKSKMAQKEFTEHLRRQGEKATSGETTSEMSTKQTVQAEPSKSEPQISEKGLMKERNKVFEVVNGNLVKKGEKIDGDLEKIKSIAETNPNDLITNIKKDKTAPVANSAEQPSDKKQDKDHGNKEDKSVDEISTKEIKKEIPNPPKEKAIDPTSTVTQNGAPKVPEAVIEDKVVITQAPLAPTETKGAAVERDRGW